MSRSELLHLLLGTGAARDLAIADDTSRITYQELRDEVAARHAWLDASRAGAVVPLPPESSIEWVVAYLGAIASGRVTMAMPPDLPQTLQATLVHRASAALAASPVPGGCALMPTSGSTGAPDFVVVTSRNLVANTMGIVRRLELPAGSRTLCGMPLGYCFAASVLHSHLAVGGSVVLSARGFSFPLLRRLRTERCTGFAGVPTMYEVMDRRGVFAGLPAHVTMLQQAGGALPVSRADRILGSLSQGTRLFVMYGQTEATARITAFDLAGEPAKIGSVGRPLDGVSVRVAGPDVHGTGVIEVSAPSVTPATLHANGSICLDRQTSGVLSTGDLGRIDADGHLFITGRKSAIIKVGGVRVNAEYVESLLAEHSGVREVVAVGLPDPIYGERVGLVVVPSSPSLDTRDIRSFLAEHAGGIAGSARMWFWDGLPRTFSGKPARALIRKLVEQNVRGTPEDTHDSGTALVLHASGETNRC